MKHLWNLITTLVVLCSCGVAFGGERIYLSDNQIRDMMIKHNLNHYSGNCPCPESTDRAGRQCGKRSAYSRPGGEQPLCYREQINDTQVREFRKINDLAAK